MLLHLQFLAGTDQKYLLRQLLDAVADIMRKISGIVREVKDLYREK